ncbi:hypothetical protein BDZ94DRAFT_1176728 [Collybia nuda]|uniref:Uncharacterized protein n=1 Tax=Collybia nuda TaxID=64659 RepID=A0A9P5XU44_9AGAR|nr:hypothetical protein BDZ94DRAFT_1176728 [Collybia nuda]
MREADLSALGPIDPGSISSLDENEDKSPWIVRKILGSVTGRIMMSSYESLRAMGTSVVCLSPWGDSSPLLLPCIRFRDLAVHTVIVATGGIAAVAAPVMGPVSDAVVSSIGDSIMVELGMHVGFDLATSLANDLVFKKPLNYVLPIHSSRLETTSVKVLLITLKHKHIVGDAALGFFRSSIHKDSSLFASVKDYLAVEKGWFSPYLFASARRPIIPRTMKPDVVFCHGPFLQGDYRIGETLLAESAFAIVLGDPPPPTPLAVVAKDDQKQQDDRLHLSIPSLSNRFNRNQSRSPSPEPALTPLPLPPAPRRMVLMVMGLRPHRKMWTTSARPGESVLNYVLLNGCPAVVVPVKVGAPLVAWDTLTLERLWKVELPPEGAVKSEDGHYENIVSVLCEFLDLCVDWARVVLESRQTSVDANGEANRKAAVRDAVALLVAAAVRSKTLGGKEAGDELDEDRAGVAMWRIP